LKVSLKGQLESVEIRKSTRAANPDFFRFYGMLVKTAMPIAFYYCRKGTVLKGKM
jgi:hypothetical protein